METNVATGLKFKHKRLAFDLDGVLVKDLPDIDAAFHDKTELEAIDGAHTATRALRKDGYEIIIHTCRPDYHRTYLESNLKRLGIEWDVILYYTKPRADLYIDDKGYRFVSFEQLINDIHMAELREQMPQQPFSEYEKVLQRQKIQMLPAKISSQILDIGCGDGSVFAQTDFTCVGIEPNEKAAKIARGCGNYSLVLPSLRELDRFQFKIKDFDFVTMLGVLEHLTEDQIHGYLSILDSEAQAVYITVPNAESFHRRIGVYLGMLKSETELSEHDHAIGHQRYYDIESLSNLISRFFSFEKWRISYGSLGFKFDSNAGMAKYIRRASSIHTAAIDCGFIGPHQYWGAELYALITKHTII